jgi:hypothetical protein
MGSLRLNVVLDWKLWQQPHPPPRATRVDANLSRVPIQNKGEVRDQTRLDGDRWTIRPRLPRGFNADVTPQTLLGRPDGTVSKVWVGAYFGQRKAEMETFFKIRLPGISEAPQRAAK